MKSNLLVTSNSNKPLVSLLGIKDFDILIIDRKLTEVLKPKKYKAVYAFGGGSVIDAAKMLAGKKPCYAIPTTASGASCTSHAVVWGKEKIDVPTKVPVLLYMYKSINFTLPQKVIRRTIFDCMCHILESRYSKKATDTSLMHCASAERMLMKYLLTNDVIDLIDAGNYAGRAIEITGTNFLHAISYVLTLDENIEHGDALREALEIHDRYNKKDVLRKAKKYKKFYETSLL